MTAGNASLPYLHLFGGGRKRGCKLAVAVNVVRLEAEPVVLRLIVQPGKVHLVQRVGASGEPGGGCRYALRVDADAQHPALWLLAQHHVGVPLQLRPALHVCIDKGLVAQAVPPETMQDAQSQGPVAARPGLDKPVGPPRRLGSIRINAPDLSAPLFRFPHILEKMEVRRQHADAPKDDEIAVLRFLRPHAQRMSHDAVPSVVLSGRANRPFQLRRAEPIKQAVVCIVLDHAHRAGKGIGQYGFTAVYI